MAPPRGSAAYKKKDGTLALSKDGQSVSWTPVAPSGSKPALTLPLPIITSESAYKTRSMHYRISQEYQISSKRQRVTLR